MTGISARPEASVAGVRERGAILNAPNWNVAWAPPRTVFHALAPPGVTFNKLVIKKQRRVGNRWQIQEKASPAWVKSVTNEFTGLDMDEESGRMEQAVKGIPVFDAEQFTQFTALIVQMPHTDLKVFGAILCRVTLDDEVQ